MNATLLAPAPSAPRTVPLVLPSRSTAQSTPTYRVTRLFRENSATVFAVVGKTEISGGRFHFPVIAECERETNAVIIASMLNSEASL